MVSFGFLALPLPPGPPLGHHWPLAALGAGSAAASGRLVALFSCMARLHGTTQPLGFVVSVCVCGLNTLYYLD